jgi:transcriptional regulator with XRE-family HTH domain
MSGKGLSQSELAKAAGVSQSTVSRALHKTPGKHSDASRRLCVYAGIEVGDATGSTVVGTKLVLKTFENIWDGTDAHAAAIARIIEASRGLKPEKI